MGTVSIFKESQEMANFAQRPNSKWQAKIRRQGWPDQSKTFHTLADAQAWARAVEREMDIGAFIQRDDAERTTFKNAAERYSREVLPSKRGKDRDQYKINFLAERFGKFSLASINPAMLSEYRDERLKVVAAQTVVHELNMLSRIFKACAMDWGIALPQGIPTALVRKPAVSNARSRRLEPREWELLQPVLAKCKSVYPLAIVELAIETAARQSELMSLTWQEVDLKNRTIRLRGVDGAVTKNGDTYRDVPLSSKAVAVLAALPRALRGSVFGISQNALQLSWERAIASARQMHVHALLTEALTTKRFSEEECKAQIRALIYKKKQPSPMTIDELKRLNESGDSTLVDLHFHDLRHEATSRLAEKLQMHELMKVTGHKSSAMLARYYHPKAADLALKLG
jgi:integrase